MHPNPVLGDSSRRYKGKWVDIASEMTFLASPRARPDPVMGRAQFLAHSLDQDAANVRKIHSDGRLRPHIGIDRP